MLDQLLRVVTSTVITDFVHLGFFLVGIAIVVYVVSRE